MIANNGTGTGGKTRSMEQVLLVFAIAVLIWLGTGVSNRAKDTKLRGPRGAKHQAGDQRP